ncbi:MAG TPA: ABC transporter substrate-binding protein [Herpetosiphon sp.]|uniref:Extracellular solute-binding protein family 1 n=1 Tax=Herpetosiphon aurantiacus (strain ATCC 23779 / DSM 785 / 114-95) TaxID=316274 RepID=A9AXT9_HERA2|nr:ABC transporter substrate-binding protein [Herpetosiphon sp.]ABX04905.1 extracellular solute-binding protein family 1 [Herpetosiphon aurantiacus DSM 785]HBW50454.1 ABC transporter substrate-binding protein [Herpetosiphon sp.]
MKSHFTRIVAHVFTVGLMASLISCGSTQVTPTVSQSAQSVSASNADPALVEASKKEADGILIYSIMSEKNWQPVIQGFNAKYPWIKVTTADLGAYEVFERYYTEAAGNARTADFISTTAPDGWINFIDKGEVQSYVSSEDAQIPELGKIAQGVYAASTDPMVFIWNKQLVADPPQTMAELISMIEKDPSAMQDKLVSYDADGEGFGYGLNWFYTKAKGADGWKTLEAIGSSQPKILTSGGKMIDSVLSGESSIGYFVSNITVQPRLEAAQQLLGYSFVPDAQVVAVRGMAVTKHAASPNSAKLLLDYILSAEGQMAFSQGGLTAYRPDIAASAPLHLSQVSQAVGGEQNIIFSRPDKALADPQQRSQFLNQWKQALGRNQ